MFIYRSITEDVPHIVLKEAATMNPCHVISCTVLFTACDLTVSTLLYICTCKKASIIQDIVQFDIFNSMVDVWGTSLLRTIISLGAVLGVVWNQINGPRRLLATLTFMTLVCYLIASYTIIKLLLYSEEEKPVQDPWFWSLVVWTWVSSAITLLAWKQMGEMIPCTQEGRSYSEVFEDQEGRQKPAEAESEPSGATVGRLLSYSKQDSAYLLIAFLFLLLCTLGE